MKVDCIYYKANTQFGSFIYNWLQSRDINNAELSNKNEDLDEGIDGIVIVTENQEIPREIEEIVNLFDFRQKPVHTMDINGTLMVAVSNLDLWLERNRCKKVLFVADDTLVKNVRLEKMFEQLT
ncbi:MAG: hypothetical protein V4638_02565 [Bacteroidota bacterium]